MTLQENVDKLERFRFITINEINEILIACISRAINNKAKDNYAKGYIITTIRDN